MNRLLKYTILFSACLYVKSDIFCAQPTGMQPTGASYFTGAGVVNYAVKPNTKDVFTNNSEIEASIIDLSDSMKISQRRIFDAYGFIPMFVTVKNKSGKEIVVAQDVLDFNLGLSVGKIKDAIIKNFALKKSGSYAAIYAYRFIVFTSLLTAAVYFPYAETFSASGELLNSTVSSDGFIRGVGTSLIGAVPSVVKFGVGTATAYLTLRHLSTSMFSDAMHGLVNSFYRIKACWNAPYNYVKELDEAIKFVDTSSNVNAYNVPAGAGKQFIIFVRREDATNIKNANTFPALKYE